MNITLRKANAIQNSILETIKNIKIETTLELNEFVEVEKELTRANAELFGNDSRRQRLLLALYNIRGLVGTANAQSGIDLNLSKCAFIDKRISQLEEFSNAKPVVAIEVIKGKLDKIRNRKEDSRASMFRDETVLTSVIAQTQIDQAKVEISNLKKQKQKLNDEILELNIKTEIPLSEDVVKTLTEERII